MSRVRKKNIPGGSRHICILSPNYGCCCVGVGDGGCLLSVNDIERRKDTLPELQDMCLKPLHPVLALVMVMECGGGCIVSVNNIR